jgi:hypothetical protein
VKYGIEYLKGRRRRGKGCRSWSWSPSSSPWRRGINPGAGTERSEKAPAFGSNRIGLGAELQGSFDDSQVSDGNQSAKQRERERERERAALASPFCRPPRGFSSFTYIPSLTPSDWHVGLHLWARLMLPSDSHRTGRRVSFFSIYILLDKSRMGCCGSLVILFQKLKPLNSSFFWTENWRLFIAIGY